MKKILFIAVIAAMLMVTLSACDFSCNVCVDSDNDGYCDNCYEPYVPLEGGNEGGNEGGSNEGGNEGGSNNGSDSGSSGNDTPSGGNNSGSNNGGNSGSANTPKPIAFNVTSSHSVIELDSGVVTFSLGSGSSLGSYSQSDVIYSVNNYSISGDSFLPTEAGKYTVTATVGGVLSANSVTLTVLPRRAAVASAVSAAMSSDKLYLGMEFDIGIPAELSSHYFAVGGEGFLRINENGKLAIVGYKENVSTYLIKNSLGTVCEGIYTMKSSMVTSVLVKKLSDSGIIEGEITEVPFEKFSAVKDFIISDMYITDEEELNVVKLLTSLESLTITGGKLGDLNYLRGLPIKSLAISGVAGNKIPKDGRYVYDVVDSMKSLESLSLIGVADCFTRETYELLVARVLKGEIRLQLSKDYWMTDAATVTDFSKTVYFSIEELRTREGNATHSVFVRAAGACNHAIIVLGDNDVNKFVQLNLRGVTDLQLYGTGKTYLTPIHSPGENSLSVILNDYSIDAYGRDLYEGAAIFAESNATVTANSGNCYVSGADSYPVVNSARTEPTVGIRCNGSTLSVSGIYEGSLTVRGGYGRLGESGTTSSKNGQNGGNGAYAIYCNTLYYNGNVKAIGGDGGAGGSGANGVKENMFSGGYNGGNGGNGGNGAAAISVTNIDFIRGMELEGGRAGSGGSKGEGVALGSDGSDGISGLAGSGYEKRSS